LIWCFRGNKLYGFGVGVGVGVGVGGIGFAQFE